MWLAQGLTSSVRQSQSSNPGLSLGLFFGELSGLQTEPRGRTGLSAALPMGLWERPVPSCRCHNPPLTVERVLTLFKHVLPVTCELSNASAGVQLQTCRPRYPGWELPTSTLGRLEEVEPLAFIHTLAFPKALRRDGNSVEAMGCVVGMAYSIHLQATMLPHAIQPSVRKVWHEEIPPFLF